MVPREKNVKNAYIAFGSNMGNRIQNIIKAIDLLDSTEGITVKKISSIYETDPIGYINQNSFLNGVLVVETALSPLQLLDDLQYIEKQLKRERIIHWGPRTIDLDILLYNQTMIKEERLIIPHPRMLERSFVLVPLLEIESDLMMPDGKKVRDYLTPLLQKQGIIKVATL